MCIMRLTLSRVPSSRLQPQVAPYVPAFWKAMRVFQCQQEGQRDPRSYTFHLLYFLLE